MKRREDGQGLVEYALILVLVATVVIAVLLLLGPAIDDVFHQIVCGMVIQLSHVETIDVGVGSVTIDVLSDSEFPRDDYYGFLVDVPPSHGTVEYIGDGYFLYQRNEDEVGSQTDDSFRFTYYCPLSYCDYALGRVSIIVGEPDFPLSVASIMSDAEQTTLELDDAREQVIILWEEAAAQEEGLREGADLVLEAAVEGLEVLVEYADDFNQQELTEILAPLIQDIRSGELDGILDAIDALGSYVGDVPLEVRTAMSLKVAPRLADSCEAMAGGLVSQDTIDAAWQALGQLDPDHPHWEEMQELLQEAVGIIEDRNDFMEQWLEDACIDP